MPSENFSAFVNNTSAVGALAGTEVVPVVPVSSATEQTTTGAIAFLALSPASAQLTNADDGNTLGTTTFIYYVSMSFDGEYSVTLPSSASMTNVILTFKVINNIDEGGLNIYPNGDDQIENGGASNPFFISGNDTYCLQLLSSGDGNWWVTNWYQP